MRIAISADHRGYAGIKLLAEKLQREGHLVQLLGDVSGPSADYPDRAYLVGKAVASGEADVGVLLERGRSVAAALTLVRAWIVAGRPKALKS